jgi:hypothetical protein
MFARSLRKGLIAVCGAAALALAGGCMTGHQGQAEADGAQVGEAVGQQAGSSTAKNVPYIGGMLGGIAGREAGAAAGRGVSQPQQATGTAQPAGQTTPAGH